MLREPKLTCRIASLCISPVHAGIMFFRTPNSSFIFDLRRRSIKLCAVFLAIFRPAALVADGCFFFDGPASPAAGVEVDAAAADAADAADAAPAFLPAPFPLVVASGSTAGLFSSCCRGFIWMIFRERVGGGGSAKEDCSLLPAAAAADDRLRDLTVSLACIR